MTKPTITQLGAVGLMLDGDPTMLPDQAFTDALNVRFNGREIESYLGNYLEPYYTQQLSGTVDTVSAMWAIQPVIYDGFSNSARVLLMAGIAPDGTFNFAQQNMSQPDFRRLGTAEGVDLAPWLAGGTPWNIYKGQINNCVFFGIPATAPLGKGYNWTGFDTLPSWGEQTTGIDMTDPNNPISIIDTRTWYAGKIISFDNRLLALNTAEEDAGGVQQPFPNRIRWSGFAHENQFPINWDDTAANRTPQDFAAAVIDGYAGWQDITTQTQIVDACENGGVLFVYTERETFSLSPSGNDSSPFITKTVYTDLGALDAGCVVNAHGHNYVFTGYDVVRHDAVSWKSIADEYVRDFVSDIANTAAAGKVRMVGYPELSEIWLMIPGTQQASGDYAKSTALTYNYIKGTWSKKTLPYIYDAVFAPIAPTGELIPQAWDDDGNPWDTDTAIWGGGTSKTAQGVLVGSCAAGGVYVLNGGDQESRWTYKDTAYSMQAQPLQVYIEKIGMEFDPGNRVMITEASLTGKGVNDIRLSIGRADNTDSGYKWEHQAFSLLTQRRTTWLAEGGAHAYRLEIAGQGAIPVGIRFGLESTGR